MNAQSLNVVLKCNIVLHELAGLFSCHLLLCQAACQDREMHRKCLKRARKEASGLLHVGTALRLSEGFPRPLKYSLGSFLRLGNTN
ncbi:hypothetical protein BU16DRAFT_336833 [Lophium mytilinum]|uniref:Uncharacterized protein n=1 Tax=Lophium mytilinum TaxID=390894 RepID=A0A6A6QXS0_9PEZI|nr:hypothetical protein BU16DRAFT_336833 [Lophium mytilinum]